MVNVSVQKEFSVARTRFSAQWTAAAAAGSSRRSEDEVINQTYATAASRSYTFGRGSGDFGLYCFSYPGCLYTA
jgi:hypothetical protein